MGQKHRLKRNRGRGRLIAHATMRAEQRSGVSYDVLRQHLRRGTTLKAARLSHTRVLKVANVEGEVVWFVYSMTAKQIVTVLPPYSPTVRDAVAANNHLPVWAVKSARAKEGKDGCEDRGVV